MEYVEIIAKQNFVSHSLGSCTNKHRYFTPKDHADFLVKNNMAELVPAKEVEKPKAKKKK